MKKSVFIILWMCFASVLRAQNGKFVVKPNLPDIKKSIRNTVEHLPLYLDNLADQSKQNDVNSIILDIEKYIDSMPKNRKPGDAQRVKTFDPLRHFFLTTTNKTAVASSFIYSGIPYQFCLYNDSASALHIWALKNGDTYNLSKITENRAVRLAMENCLLPALKALDEFNPNEIKYVGLSIYYGCKDTREGAPKIPVAPYCLTLVARLADIQQYGSGLITAKGLMAGAEVYINSDDASGEFRKIQIDME